MSLLLIQLEFRHTKCWPKTSPNHMAWPLYYSRTMCLGIQGSKGFPLDNTWDDKENVDQRFWILEASLAPQEAHSELIWTHCGHNWIKWLHLWQQNCKKLETKINVFYVVDFDPIKI